MARIVLIDDEAQLRDLIALMLQRWGHEVFPEPDGRKGMQRVRACSPDLVITDIIMPDQEGIGTILELRGAHRGVKIIAISGGGRNSGQDYLALAKKLGADCVLEKPFERQELKAALEQCGFNCKEGAS